MACTPTPTSTVFSTSTSTTFSLTTVTTSEVDTITSTSTSIWTSCLVENATASGGATCLSSTVGTTSALIPVVTTVPITQTNTVPVNVPVQVPIQTLFSDCPSDGSSQNQQQSSSPRNDDSSTSTTTQSHTRVTVSYFITYSDSDGLHVSQSASVSDGQLNQPTDNPTSKSNLAPIIGGVVGGVVAILALIGLVWYILWRRDQNRFLFEEDEDGAYRPKSVGRRGRRSLNLDDETKGLDVNAYQYGVVGSTNSPSTSPLPHSQFSSLGEYSHRRSLSREALMTAGGPSSSIPNSPQRLDIPLGGAQRRISQNTSSSTRGESIMMTNQPVQNRPSDDVVPWGHHPRPSSSLLESPMVYPPGANSGTGFYQQYGPLESQPAGATGSTSPTAAATAAAAASRGMHKPPLEPSLIPATQPVAAHQSLLAAAGLSEPSTSRTIPVIAAPPPGAAGARPYVEQYHRGDTLGDLHSAVMASADRVVATNSPTPSAGSGVDVGFGRQRRPEKTPRVDTPRSPVIQHEDAGQAPASNAAAEAPPPAYSPS